MELDRRSLMAAAALLPAAAVAQSSVSPDAKPAPQPAPAGSPVTDAFVGFAAKLRYEDVPAEAVHACKRLLLDTLGCTLAGWQSNKGRLAAGLMQELGGEPKALVIGTKRRIAPTNAAFANAELTNGLDYDAIPHLPPVVIPPLLAAAEASAKSGRDLIRGVIIAYEIGARLSGASSQMAAAILETNTTPEVFDINNEAIMASAAGIAAINGLDAQGIAFAIGLGGYYCPPQVAHDWETGTPKSDVKYTPVGWVAQGAVTAAMLAGTGFTSNPIVLDGPAGFPRFYGWPKWRAERAVAGLGSEWRVLNPDFKPYAACRYIHSRIDALREAMAKGNVKPGTVDRIYSLGAPFVANPDQRQIHTQQDAQFSIPYMLALVALGIPLDARCQRAELLNDPKVHAMMAKIEWGTHPRTAETKRADPRSFIANAEVTSGGSKSFAEVWAASGTSALPDRRINDADLERKFLANAGTRLPATQARKLADMIWQLEKVASTRQLTALLEA
jgi:2-methylcitrate dehydratase PrpD